MPSHNEFTWKLEAPIVDKSDSQITLFEKFFTEDILYQICTGSIRYEKFKRCQNFGIAVDTLKTFYYFTFKQICGSPKTPHVLRKYCRCAKYCHIITHVKEQI